jgi:hypothetical protein
MLKHIRCIKYIKYLKYIKHLHLYRFRAFIGPSSGVIKICEVMNCTSPRQTLIKKISLHFYDFKSTFHENYIRMMIIMSMGLDYVSKLQPQMGILFIPQVIYEHGDPCWNDIDRGKLPIRPPELSGNLTSKVI